ncbi:hypothetical protein AGLY_017831 [Aphis glycines]|uniref:Double jelly roll-like domain-containing protein n=1 Tax=Aphis glycines TaxID=307491 RepID=A0A6G0STR2_APHGL|nr:hypothetical protein AGLY_017831 [Aphis glycines]
MSFGKNISNFRGCFVKDKLPLKPWKNECGILNLKTLSNPFHIGLLGIFGKYDKDIIREQDKIYGPTSLSNLNSANQITTFNIKEENSFLNIKKSKYQLSGRVLQADDTIDNVGRCSLIKGTISYSADLSGPTINCGFQSKFTDIQYPVYKGEFEISFLRHSDGDALFREKNDKNELPSAVYDDMNKIKLINELTSLSQRNEYMFIFKSWQCIEDRNITGKTLTKDITNMYKNVHNPLFAIVAFQTDKLDNQLRDPIQFNNCNLNNICLDIDSMRYPEELLNLDFKNEKFNIAYDMLMDYKNIHNRLHRDLSLMYVTPQQFKDTRPFFISGPKTSIVLHADFNEDVSTNTICYICLVSGTEFFYDFANNTIRENI